MNNLTLFHDIALSRDIVRSPLYFKRIYGNSHFHRMFANDGTLCINRDEIISFDCYFNAFYERYITSETDLKKIFLKLEVRGSGTIEVFRFISGKTARTLDIIQFGTESTEILCAIPLDSHHELGSRLAFHVTGGENGCTVVRGGWFTDQPAKRKVVLNIAICTFKKLQYLDRIVTSLLNHNTLRSCDWKLLIVDNASEISANRYNSENVRIFRQGNVGGTGGFTRGIIETVCENEESGRKASHILLMDDDIELNPQCIVNAIRFLEYSKEEVCLGGGMIDMDRATVMHEHGAKIGDRPDGRESFIFVVARNNNLNLTQPASLCLLSRRQPSVTYNAWWFFAFPVHACQKVGFPMPCFIRGDDQEFGIRLTQNGFLTKTPPSIALWHEPFEAKQAAWTDYFGCYNALIIAASRQKDSCPKAIKNELQESFIYPLLRRKNYSFALAIIAAVEDFLKGPEFFTKTTPEERLRRARSFDIEYGPEKIEAVKNLPPPGRIKTLIGREIWRQLDYGNTFHGLLRKLGFISDSALIPECEWNWKNSSLAETLYIQSPHHPEIRIYKTDVPLYKASKAKADELLAKFEREFSAIARDFQAATETYEHLPFWKDYLGLNKTVPKHN